MKQILLLVGENVTIAVIGQQECNVRCDSRSVLTVRTMRCASVMRLVNTGTLGTSKLLHNTSLTLLFHTRLSHQNHSIKLCLKLKNCKHYTLCRNKIFVQRHMNMLETEINKPK